MNQKNGFTNFHIKMINQVKKALREGATLEACSVLIAIDNDVDESYVRETYISYRTNEIITN